MKKEKLVISLILVVIMIFTFSINVLAANDVTPLRTSSNTTPTTSVQSGSNSTLTPATGNSISIGGGNAGASANQAGTGTTNAATNNSGTSSSYRNVAQNVSTSKDDLPYTGSSYGVVFVIVALVVSAVYAYKKVSDYNM